MTLAASRAAHRSGAAVAVAGVRFEEAVSGTLHVRDCGQKSVSETGGRAPHAAPRPPACATLARAPCAPASARRVSPPAGSWRTTPAMRSSATPAPAVDMVISSGRSDAPGGPRRRAPRLGARDADVAQHLITQLHERAALARPVVPGQQRFDDPHEGVPHRGPEAGLTAARRSVEATMRRATLEPGSQAAHTIRPTRPERPASVPSVSLPSRHHLLVWLPA